MDKTGKGACYQFLPQLLYWKTEVKTKSPPKILNISRYIIKVNCGVLYLREGGPNLTDEDPVPSLLTNKRDCRLNSYCRTVLSPSLPTSKTEASENCIPCSYDYRGFNYFFFITFILCLLTHQCRTPFFSTKFAEIWRGHS